MDSTSTRRRNRGFTLVELVVTMAIAAILLMVAGPSMADLVRNNRIAAAHNRLITALHVARAESLRRGRAVTVCASADERQCSGSDDWSTGWLVFEDSAATGDPAAFADAEYDARMVEVAPAIGEQMTLAGDSGWYRYLPTGSVAWSGTGVAAESGFALRAGSGRSQARCVLVSRIGRVRTQTGDCP